MNSAIAFGAMLPTFPQAGDTDFANVVATARRCEQIGFSHLYVWDHLHWHGPNLECLTTVASVLAVTESVSVGPGVLQAPLRSFEASTHAIASLRESYGDRVHLGIGAGQRPEEFARLGVDYTQRWTLAEDWARQARQLFDGESTQRAAFERPTPAHPVQMWVGGKSSAALRTATVAGGWLPGFISPDSYARSVAGRTEHGWAIPDRLGVAIFVGMPGRQEEGSAWLASLYALPAVSPKHVHCGDDSVLLSEIDAYRAVGVRHIALAFAHDYPIEVLDARPALVEAIGRHRGSDA